MTRLYVLLRGVFACAFLFASATLPAFAQTAPTAQPEACKMGVYIVGLHELDTRRKTFDTDFWLWSLCSREERQPLKTMEFPTANRTTASLDSTLPRGETFWSVRKISGTFRHEWDVRNFPFDRHVLHLVMEEGIDDTRTLQYEADQRSSGYDKRIDISGWNIEDFSVAAAERSYQTNFGDPSLENDAASQYARMTAEITISRTLFTSITSFFKMSAVVYVAAALALLSFLFHLDASNSFGSRITFLAGALFAIVINMRASSADLGSSDALTLIDLVHITCLALILAATVLTVVADRMRAHGNADAIRRFDLRNSIICGVAFVAANVGLVAMAIRG